MTTTPDYAAYDAKLTAYRCREDELWPNNKAALFAALAAAAVHTVVVAFDGSGDSGQIESVTGFDAANRVIDLPSDVIGQQAAVFDSAEVQVTASSVADAIESMAYEALSKRHGGWEIDEGSYGDITFTVVDQTIAVDLQARFTDSTHHHYDL